MLFLFWSTCIIGRSIIHSSCGYEQRPRATVFQSMNAYGSGSRESEFGCVIIATTKFTPSSSNFPMSSLNVVDEGLTRDMEFSGGVRLGQAVVLERLLRDWHRSEFWIRTNEVASILLTKHHPQDGTEAHIKIAALDMNV